MPDDGYRYELIEGELIRMSPAGAEHGMVAMNITGPLFAHVFAHDLGQVFAAETGFQLESDPDTVCAPDVAFVCKARVEGVGVIQGYWPGAPDFAVEVMSPNDSTPKTDAKAKHWISAGAKLVWVVNPRKRTVTVYKSLTDIFEVTENEVLHADEVLTGFQLAVSEVF